MRLFFGSDDTLHIVPENDIECMALKYWILEYKAHGPKMLVLDLPSEYPAPT